MNPKSLLYRLFTKLFAGKYSADITEALKKGNAEYSDRSDKAEMLYLSNFIGKPVICISNEWENPVIGFGTQIQLITKAQNPVLVVHDYVTGQDLIVMGKVFVYTSQRFNTLMKLTPFELMSFVYSNYEDDIHKDVKSERETKTVIIGKLIASGFFIKLGEYTARLKLGT